MIKTKHNKKKTEIIIIKIKNISANIKVMKRKQFYEKLFRNII